MFHSIKRKINSLTSDEKFREILTGSAWALSARVMATVLGMISTIIIARFFGAKAMGVVAVITSFLALTTIFTVFGTSTSILRLLPEHMGKYSNASTHRLYRKILLMVIGVSLVTGTLLFFNADFIAERVFVKANLSFYLTLASAFVIFNSLTILNTQAIRSIRRIKSFALMLVLPQGFNVIFLISLSLFLSTKDVPVYALFLSFAMTGVIGWIIIEYAFRNDRLPNDLVKSVSTRKILSVSLPMLMTTTMTLIIGQSGVIMLGMFRTEAEVGYYAIAFKLATLTAFILEAINAIAAPTFSDLFHSGKIEEVFYVAKKSAKLIFWTTTPLLIGLVIFGKPVLSIVFGQQFAVAYTSMVLLVFGQFVNAISGSTGYFMNMTGRQKEFGNIMLMAAIINIILNLCFLPSYGVIGAAFAGMISISFLNIATLLYMKVKHGRTTGYFPRLF